MEQVFGVKISESYLRLCWHIEHALKKKLFMTLVRDGDFIQDH